MCETHKSSNSTLIPEVFTWFPCHKREDRSFHIKGRKFPICARCTAILFGYACLPFLMGFHVHLTLWLVLLLCGPLVVDGYTQRWKWRTSNNVLRFVTGLAFGIGQCILIIAIITFITKKFGI